MARIDISHGPSSNVPALTDHPPANAAPLCGVTLAPAGVTEHNDFVQLGRLEGHSSYKAQRRQSHVKPETVEKLLVGNDAVLVGVVGEGG